MKNVWLIIAVFLFVGCQKDPEPQKEEIKLIDIVPLLNKVSAPEGVKVLKNGKFVYSKYINVNKEPYSDRWSNGLASFDITLLKTPNKYIPKIRVLSAHVVRCLVENDNSIVPVYSNSPRVKADERHSTVSYVLWHKSGQIFITFSKFDWKSPDKECIKMEFFVMKSHIEKPEWWIGVGDIKN